MQLKKLLLAMTMATGMAWVATAFGGSDRPTEYTNQNSIINTRHNLTFRSAGGADLLAGGPNNGGGATSSMGMSVNNYGQVCVYCHTPHGANALAAAPLWNRATPATTYTTYNQLGTDVSQAYAQPGGASLACLSCHDGQQAIDAIMNMPGSGRYSTSPNNEVFLDSWPGIGLIDHASLTTNQADPAYGCLGCHSPGEDFYKRYASDFTVAAIGTDLRNDHPVGVAYPTANGSGTDWETPTGNKTIAGLPMKFFDDVPNSRLDKSEIRLYPSANGPAVECASCHDPHGVPSGAAGSQFIPTFMRKSIAASNLCLTCHAK